MTYELAKELKEAGFHQEVGMGSDYFYGPNDRHHVQNPVTLGEEDAKVPTLEELIEACGKEFQLVAQKEKCWRASSFLKLSDTRHLTAEGSTPTEAVAKLWLALNDKK